jgi:hypothetical protein
MKFFSRYLRHDSQATPPHSLAEEHEVGDLLGVLIG